MKNTLVWRLSKLPTPEELVELVKNKIITQEEAKEIILSSENKEDREIKSLEAEIKFLKEVIEKMPKHNIREIITYVEKPYRRWNWYEDTATYLCNANSSYTKNGAFILGNGTFTADSKENLI